MQNILMLTASILLFALPVLASPVARMPERPRVVVLMVVDQLRSDQLLRWQNRLQKNGLGLFFREGALAPYGEYKALQNMTCPGHAMIATGSNPARNKIVMNDWFDRQTKKMTYCADDPKDRLSPRNLVGSTIGDQMRLAWPESRVVAVSLKDRSAIMLGGHAADAAYWMSEDWSWETSTYYSRVPENLRKIEFKNTPQKDESFVFKNELSPRAFSRTMKWGDKEAYGAPITMTLTRQMAEKAFLDFKIAQDEIPDLFAVSFSTHDIAGHFWGPDTPEMDELILQEDLVFAQWFEFLNKNIPGGLQNAWLVLTADHGVAPLAGTAKSMGLHAGQMSAKEFRAQLNQSMKARFGSCKGDYLIAVKSFQFYFNEDCLKNRREALMKFAKAELLKHEGVEEVVTKIEFEEQKVPFNFSREIQVSYSPMRSGDLVVVPKPFWYEKDGPPAGHVSSYSYDRYVPVYFWGKPFAKRVSYEPTLVLDIAPTITQLLGVLPPAQNEGRVLTELLKEK